MSKVIDIEPINIPVDIAILTQPFNRIDLYRRFDALGVHKGRAGAVVTFMGQVRESGDRQHVTGMVLEHYAAMTERVLRKHVASACQRWPLLGVVLVHRVGAMGLGDPLVGLVVARAHRHDAFDAVQYLMDFLKQDAPFWKQEVTDEGAEWVDQKETDWDHAKRW